MSNLVKTYFLAPNFDLAPPPFGPLFLGSVIADPKNPARSMTRDNRIAIPSPGESIHHSLKLNWSVTRAQLREGKIGIWASSLAAFLGTGADAEISISHDTDEIYRCERLETEYFQPDETYIYKALQVPRVKSYIEKSWLGKPVYMITGLKVARGATAESGEGRGSTSNVKIGVHGTPAVVSVSGGLKLNGKVERKERISWEGSSDFVFAYRVIRIKSKKKDGTFTDKDYNNGALYNADDDEAKEENSVERLHREWEIGDFDGTVDGVVANSVADEDGLDRFIVAG
jgi:hypothetical protein